MSSGSRLVVRPGTMTLPLRISTRALLSRAILARSSHAAIRHRARHPRRWASSPRTRMREVSLRSLAVLQSLGPEIQWVRSYVTDDRVLPAYITRTTQGPIREHARQLLACPPRRVSAVPDA